MEEVINALGSSSSTVPEFPDNSLGVMLFVVLPLVVIVAVAVTRKQTAT